MFSFLSQIPKAFRILFYAIDWGFNPTHTNSALIAAESFLNAKKSYPRIMDMFDAHPEIKAELESEEFAKDMAQDWDFDKFLIEYKPGTLGYEYATFMKTLNYQTLHFNLGDHIPELIRNIFKMGVRNHDVVHFLLGLYDNNNGKLGITDFHEWVFLGWTNAQVGKAEKIVDLFLLPSKIKSFLTFRKSEFDKSQKLGAIMAKNSKDLNQIWLKPYFSMSVEEARKALSVITLDEALQLL
jgi:ubiquinone biosynthesis protein Coq4